MDLKKLDKNGNPLNLTGAHDKKDKWTGSDYYSWYKNDPSVMEPTDEDIKCELQLQALGDFEQLDFSVNQSKFENEISECKDWFVPYLRREGVSNDREGIMLFGLEGDEPSDSLSRPEAMKRTGRMLKETDFSYPTKAYTKLTSLHSILDHWDGLGRTMIIKSNKGGWFPPHRDNPNLTRPTFRVIAFLGRASANDSYEWWLGDRPQNIIPYSTYFVDTRKVHRTHSWEDDSYHLILNVPKTWDNVMRLMSVLKYS